MNPAPRLALVLLALVVLPRPSEAQTARPGVDCSLLTAQQAHGLPCAVPPTTPPPALAPPLVGAPTQLDDDCLHLDPYRDGEKTADCARRPLPGASTPIFLIHHVYALGYHQLKAVVIGVTTDLDGIQVVTFRWLPESLNDGVTAQRTPPAPGGRSNWIYIGSAVTR